MRVFIAGVCVRTNRRARQDRGGEPLARAANGFCSTPNEASAPTGVNLWVGAEASARGCLGVGRQPDSHVTAACRRIVGDRLSLVRLRDSRDDREPETGASVAAALIGAAKALERAAEEQRRKAGPLVTDGELDCAVLG